MSIGSYKLTIHITGNGFNKTVYINYNEVDELYEIFTLLSKLEKSIHNISILNISFNILNTKSNIININKFSGKILESKFVKDFCSINESKILIYNEEEDSIRKFIIILDKDELPNKMDLHMVDKTRMDFYLERSICADP